MHTLRTVLLISLLATATHSLPAYADEADANQFDDALFGNWGGLRNRLDDAGIGVTVNYKADLWRNTSGGIKRGNNYNDNLDLQFDFDNEKIFGLKGSKAGVYFINNMGGQPNAKQVGSVQGIDNVEVTKNSAKVYEAWLEQNFFDDRLSLLAGLKDLNAEFVVTDSTANFIKPVMQIGQEFAQSGRNGPSVFPNTALSARVRVHPSEETYVMGSVFNAIAGDPDNMYGNHFRFGGGLLLIAEAGYVPAGQGEEALTKFALGGWRYTKGFDDQVLTDDDGNPIGNRSQGVYALSSYQFYREKDTKRSATVFFRPGIADGDTKQVKWSYQAGVMSRGWVPTRPEGEIGFGLAQAHNSHKYITSVMAAGDAVDRNEYSYELYYRDTVYPGVALQPDLQYVVNPGTTPARDDAKIIGLRVDVNF